METCVVEVEMFATEIRMQMNYCDRSVNSCCMTWPGQMNRCKHVLVR